METLTYKLEREEFNFEGPLDLLLTLIQKNKVNIRDIPIALICDQYLEYLQLAKSMDMELAGEFIVMASELMLIKSKMLLPRAEADEGDPREELADALLRYQQAKEAAVKMAELYKIYSGRFVKDTDEISVDSSFVADQQVTSLCTAVRRIIAANESRPKIEKQVFAPMIAKPIVPVEVKIVGILHRMERKEKTSMKELLADAVSLPDLIAIFLGVLELVKVRKILIREDDVKTTIHGVDTKFSINENPVEEETPEGEHKRAWENDGEPILLSSRAEMHKEQRMILRERRLEQKKRLREAERLKNQTTPADDSDLEEEARIAEALENQLSEQEEDLLDDIGMDLDEIALHMAKRLKELKEKKK